MNQKYWEEEARKITDTSKLFENNVGCFIVY